MAGIVEHHVHVGIWESVIQWGILAFLESAVSELLCFFCLQFLCASSYFHRSRMTHGEWWNIANLHVHIAILKVLSGRKYSLVLDGDFWSYGVRAIASSPRKHFHKPIMEWWNKFTRVYGILMRVVQGEPLIFLHGDFFEIRLFVNLQFFGVGVCHVPTLK